MIFIRQIQQATADFYGLPFESMQNHCKDRKVARPRMMAMTICSILTKHNTVEIGKLFHRDHSTVIHAVRKGRKRSADPATSLAMKAIAHRLLLEEAHL